MRRQLDDVGGNTAPALMAWEYPMSSRAPGTATFDFMGNDGSRAGYALVRENESGG